MHSRPRDTPAEHRSKSATDTGDRPEYDRAAEQGDQGMEGVRLVRL